MKISNFLISKIAYILATICFIGLAVWVSTTFKPASSIPLIQNDLIANEPTSVPSPLVVSPQVTSIPTEQVITSTITPTKSNRCIITIDGQNYDVTLFRRKHEGGDVFKCGCDMSKEFHEKHPAAFLKVLFPFKV